MTLNPGSSHPGSQMFAPLDSAGGAGMSPQSLSMAVALNVGMLLLFLFVIRMNPVGHSRFPIQSILNQPLTLPAELLARPKLEGGGGGGNAGLTPPSHGAPPRFAVEQLIPSQLKPVDSPTLAVDPSINAQMNMAPSTNIGLLSSTLTGNSLGTNKGVGIGVDNGSGYDHGTVRGTGDHAYRPGGNISAPQVLFAPEPEFSETARRQKLSGNVLVYLIVDSNGRPTHLRIVRGLGSGLDEKALEAVSHYKFKPAMQNGHAVPVEMNVDVNFQIF